MVKVSDCTCCDCDSAQERETIKERALSSVNKIYTFDNRTFWPDGTGMVTLPLPTQEQLNKLDDVAELSDQVAKNTKDIGVNAELIAGEQTQIDSLKTTLETSYQVIVQKGSANGYAGLDNNARVPLAQLYAGTSANQVPLIGKQLLANEMLVVDADGLTVRSKPIVQTLSFRGIYPAKSALPSEGNVSGDYAIVSDGTAQDDTGYYVWGYNTATSEYEWVWTILFDANSYQLISNLVTTIDSSSDDSHYPSAKAVKDYHDASVGTLEQEITDINNDMAELQTTVNGHTEEITAVNTLANRAYDDVEIADSVMTFTRGNGGTTQIEIPKASSFTIIPPIFISLEDFDYTKTAITSTSYAYGGSIPLVYAQYVKLGTPSSTYPTMITPSPFRDGSSGTTYDIYYITDYPNVIGPKIVAQLPDTIKEYIKSIYPYTLNTTSLAFDGETYAWSNKSISGITRSISFKYNPTTDTIEVNDNSTSKKIWLLTFVTATITVPYTMLLATNITV